MFICPPIAWSGDAMIVTSPFAVKRDIYADDKIREHRGLDLRSPVGTPILAVRAGTISRVDQAGEGKGITNGNAVFLNTDNGYRVCYLHLSDVLCKPGDAVRPGQLLGYTGVTGRITAAHLHLHVYGPDRKETDPAALFPPGWLKPKE